MLAWEMAEMQLGIYFCPHRYLEFEVFTYICMFVHRQLGVEKPGAHVTVRGHKWLKYAASGADRCLHNLSLIKTSSPHNLQVLYLMSI